MTERLFSWAAWGVTALVMLPLLSVIIAALGGSEASRELAATVLPRYAANTAMLTGLVAIGTVLVGTGAAWFVTACSFPGRRLLEPLLALPLAFPAYVLAYAYTDLLDHPGPVQAGLRSLTGWGPRDYWFPEIRSLPGAALMLVLVLYPYVYLLARASFLRQSGSAYTAARVLGASPWRAFLTVSLPMARPGIAGGMLLAMMETIADFGTVAHFSVQTFATGIYQAWFSFGDRAGAAQLAVALLTIALLVASLERLGRGRSARHGAGRSDMRAPRHRLSGWRIGAALGLCGLPVLLGFFLPLLILIRLALRSGGEIPLSRYATLFDNSLTVAGIAGAATLLAAVLIGFAARLRPGRAAQAALLAAGVGYAVPGGVIAVGLLVPGAAMDNALDGFLRSNFGVSSGLLLTGSITLLVLAYVSRFLAAALSAFDSGLESIRPNTDWAARTLGLGPGSMLMRIHLPILRPALFTGLLVVVVDSLKELPATLILRPFNFDTLAVQAYRLASDERLAEAAIPSLAIAAFGLIPVVLLIRGLSHDHGEGR